MTMYDKGANAERELMKILYANGFSVLRSSGSGVNQLPAPDVIALKEGTILLFECKAWKGNYIYIELQKMMQLDDFAQRSHGNVIAAWKLPHKGWLFIPRNQLKKTRKHFTISKNKALKHAVKLSVLSGMQKTLSY